MKKKLTNPTIVDELREGSVFFRRPAQAAATQTTPATAAPTHVPSAPLPKKVRPTFPSPRLVELGSSPQQASSHGSMTSRYHDRLIEDIRKAVKVVGREPGTIRLTEQEKSQLTDIIYTLGRQGKRTSENELYRVALNFLLEDWREYGKESVLARVLAALHA